MTATTRCKIFLIAALSACALHARADALPDPTRPPAAVLAAPTEATSTPAQALQLQSVLLGRGRTPAAVISGELVLLGGRVQDARLMRVTEHSAVLQGPQGETTLHLLPAFSLAPSDRLAIRALSSQVPRPRLDLLPVADGTPTSQSRP